ncbi:MAG: hypothetical protein Q8O76_06460 [Chloroflexota bacterium]|nr:hypothetical protein [Chloroflexota bacterium]
MAQGESCIARLPALVEELPPDEKALFHRLYHLSVTTGELRLPKAMIPWVEKNFGSPDQVERQKIVKLTNKVTLEGALFNALRANRPIQVRERLSVWAHLIDESKDDPLNDPVNLTPEDTFGRIKGKHSITASNIAKYDGLHAMAIFDEHNPLLFDRERIMDYIDTAWRWATAAHHADPRAKYPFFMWNCLWRAGASLAHGHAQLVLGRDIHYAKIEGLRRAALSYRALYRANYFDDLYRVHQALGCGFEKEGTRVLAHLTPVKEKEIVLIADRLSPSLKERSYEALACFRDSLGVISFNLAVYGGPMGAAEEDWEGFPVIARMVDRGDPGSRASDFGTMELYATPVIAFDPFLVAQALRRCLLEEKPNGPC